MPREARQPASHSGGRDADLKSLARLMRRSERADRMRTFLLAAPLLVLLLFSFAIPILTLLARAVYDPVIADALPRTSLVIGEWDGMGIPDDPVLTALAGDLVAAEAAGSVTLLAKSLNARLPGARSQIIKTARRLAGAGDGDPAQILRSIPFWGRTDTWAAIEAGTSRFTSFYLLSAFDLRKTPEGAIASVPPTQAVFVQVFVRTFTIAGIVTLATLILGFPLAYLIANAPKGLAMILIVTVLLPFWVSILVRTAAWTVLLQKFGLINDFLLWLGAVSDRLDLMYSRLGLILAMTHIQLPFTLLPIYSVMRTIPPSQLRAAYSLGGRPLTSFRRVYLPQVFPGVIAGCLLTFILCLGYYITPALVGGPGDQLISNIIANYVNIDLNWEMAAALSLVLLASTLVLFGLAARLIGLNRLKMV